MDCKTKLVVEFYLYAFTTLASLGILPFFRRARNLTVFRIVIVLFVLDSVLTVEAAFYANIVFIGILHVITIPAFLVLLYLDLTKQSKDSFTCFVCSTKIGAEQESETVTRVVKGIKIHAYAHTSCLEPGRKQKKAFSSLIFRRGIPE